MPPILLHAILEYSELLERFIICQSIISRQYVTLEILSCTCVEFVALMGEYGLDVPFYPLYFVAMQIMCMEI